LGRKSVDKIILCVFNRMKFCKYWYVCEVFFVVGWGGGDRAWGYGGWTYYRLKLFSSSNLNFVAKYKPHFWENTFV
jgi:hypothetical protein